MSRSYADFWQDAKWADVEIVLVTEEAANPAAQQPTQLAKFPGHRLLLSGSSYLLTQLQRWQRKRAREDEKAPANTSSSKVELSVKASSDAAEQPVSVQLQLVSAGTGTATQPAQLDHGQPQLVLTLQDADEQPAAMAVLGSLYHIKPLPELLSDLTQVQQLQAAVLADRWEVRDVSAEVVRLLLAAPDSYAGPTEQLALYYAQMPAVPSFLLPLLQKVVAVFLDSSNADVKCAGERALLSVLGDFGAVWADKALQQVLLQLPLPMMELLLASDQLKVDSEATVLYTAQHYVDSLGRRPQAEAILRLGPLIRCQHLSLTWLSAVASARAAVGSASTASHLFNSRHKLVLACQVEFVRNLLKLKILSRVKAVDKCDNTQQGWPDSWFRGPRQYQPQDSAQMACQMDVSQLHKAAIRCAKSKGEHEFSLDPSTPVRGFPWKLVVVVDRQSPSGMTVGVFVVPNGDESALLKPRIPHTAASGRLQWMLALRVCMKAHAMWKPRNGHLGKVLFHSSLAACMVAGMTQLGQQQGCLPVGHCPLTLQ